MFFPISVDIKNWFDKKNKPKIIGSWVFSNKNKQLLDDCEIIDDNFLKISDNLSAQRYLYRIYLKNIKIVSSKLNQYHNLNHKDKYWEYLIGIWYWNFIISIYDRYLSIKKIQNKYPKINIKVNNEIFYTKSHTEYYKLVQTDEYNYYLFSQVILNIKNEFNLQIVSENYRTETHEKGQNNYSDNYLSFLKFKKLFDYLRSIKYGIKEFIGSRNNNFLDLNSPLSYDEKIKIYKELKQTFYVPSIFSKKTKKKFIKLLNNKTINTIKRKKIFNFKNESDNEFEILLNKLIVYNFPIEYLENYFKNLFIVKKNFPSKTPKIILVRSQDETSTAIRFFIGECINRNSKIISCQEGGGVGSKLKSIYTERLYSRLSDIWLNWGWFTRNKKIQRFHFTKNSWIEKYEYNKKGNLLIVGSSCRKYFTSFIDGQSPFYNKIQLKLNLLFIENLNINIFKNLIFRLHWKFGYDEDIKLKNKFPDIQLSYRENLGHHYDLLFKSKLVICTSDFTNFKQNLIINHPTILLWDKNYFKIRKEAQKYYDMLYEYKILHYDPLICANFVNEIYDNPLIWWNSTNVQKTLKIFMNNFCNKSDDIVNQMVKLVNNE